MKEQGRIIITGATGFVGGRLRQALADSDAEVVCTSRDPARARREVPDCEWVELDVDTPATIQNLLRPGDRVVYLVHGMAGGGDYSRQEATAATRFGDIARSSGVERIVYLGGTKPAGTPSKHLASRLRTGLLLRKSTVPTVELRASMIIGAGSESFEIARDLALRLPVMLTPRWLRNRSEPIAIDDVIFALKTSLEMPLEQSVVYPLPGPEILSFEQMLVRIAALRGVEAKRIAVPFLTPRLSSYWLKFVTGADTEVARELVEGLRSDLLAPDRGFWKEYPDHELTSFDQAVERALAESDGSQSVSTAAAERLVRRLTPSRN